MTVHSNICPGTYMGLYRAELRYHRSLLTDLRTAIHYWPFTVVRYSKSYLQKGK